MFVYFNAMHHKNNHLLLKGLNVITYNACNFQIQISNIRKRMLRQRILQITSYFTKYFVIVWSTCSDGNVAKEKKIVMKWWSLIANKKRKNNANMTNGTGRKQDRLIVAEHQITVNQVNTENKSGRISYETLRAAREDHGRRRGLTCTCTFIFKKAEWKYLMTNSIVVFSYTDGDIDLKFM